MQGRQRYQSSLDFSPACNFTGAQCTRPHLICRCAANFSFGESGEKEKKAKVDWCQQQSVLLDGGRSAYKLHRRFDLLLYSSAAVLAISHCHNVSCHERGHISHKTHTTRIIVILLRTNG